MNKLTTSLIIIYALTSLGGWYIFSKNASTNTTLSRELLGTKNELSITKDKLVSEQAALTSLKNKTTEAYANAAFLALALCPTLEATNKDALCVEDNTEWFSQTIQTGTLITDHDIKNRMGALLVSIGAKKKPTAKQLYEMLKPIESDSLKALVENLK